MLFMCGVQLTGSQGTGLLILPMFTYMRATISSPQIWDDKHPFPEVLDTFDTQKYQVTVKSNTMHKILGKKWWDMKVSMLKKKKLFEEPKEIAVCIKALENGSLTILGLTKS